MKQPPVSAHQVEIVERKGVGHPDSICDAVMEEISIALSREYLARFDKILHHNIDKGLLIAGEVTRLFGGGSVDVPMRLIVGDRATFNFGGDSIDVQAIVEETARRWVRENLRFVDPQKDVVIETALRPGSTELTDIFERGDRLMSANDTSAAVGYAPLTVTEKLVLETERYINSVGFKEVHPAAGEDVKVMGFRVKGELLLTIALPLIDRFVENEAEYWSIKEAVGEEITKFARRNLGPLESIKIELNTLDKKGRGMGGIYLSVTGTSAEDADSGEVGRGNRVNGVIALNRPSGMEAAAGKNPTSHVGKIYSILAHRIANEIYLGVEGVAEVYVWLASQIGRPVDEPRVASAQLILKPGVAYSAVADKVAEIIDLELSEMAVFIADLAEGRYRVW
ncbi:MAG: methionine adenosyltransferase [Actinobacteria bacterium]|nr:methionine adenosyltransferase [Actinomycetota bacterium]